MENNKKTVEQIDDDEKKFYELQEKYIKTGDMTYIWKMYPIIKSCLGSCIKKRAKHNFISHFDDIVEDIALTIVERYRNKAYPEGGYQFFKAMVDQSSKSYYLPKYRETYSYELLEEDTNRDFCIDDEGIIHPVSSFV